MKFTKSKELLSRAEKVIPSCSQTFSKGPNQWVNGVSPHYLKRGEGAWVWDADGNRFLDWMMALGPVILGYNNQKVNEAIIRQVQDGPTFSMMHPLEVEVSELMVEHIPCAEMVRFAKTGSDAVAASVRLARHITGRDHVAMCSYHGWHDWSIGTTTRDGGIPEAIKSLSHTFIFNDLDSLKQVFSDHPGQIAAVVMEPIVGDPPAKEYLAAARKLVHAEGAILIFDEIVSGFRFGMSGGQGYLGVKPDLACFGKGMANGMPLSAVVGQRALMEEFDNIFFSGTFGGETLSLAAGKATIEELCDTDALERIRNSGQALIDGIQKLINHHGLNDVIRVAGTGVRSGLGFLGVDDEELRVRRSYLMQECMKRGLLYFTNHLPSAAHGPEEVDFSLDVLNEALALFAIAYQNDDFASRMEGDVVAAIFRPRT